MTRPISTQKKIQMKFKQACDFNFTFNFKMYSLSNAGFSEQFNPQISHTLTQH